MSIMDIKKRNKLNIIRISIASIVIICSINDYVCSFINENIQIIATCDKLGYGDLSVFRTHMIISSIGSCIYILLVLLHMTRYRGELFRICLSIIDCIILCIYFKNLFTI